MEVFTHESVEHIHIYWVVTQEGCGDKRLPEASDRLGGIVYLKNLRDVEQTTILTLVTYKLDKEVPVVLVSYGKDVAAIVLFD